MSAIAGIFYLDGRPAEPLTVESMLRPLERRGPDANGIQSEGPVGLGHAHLRTTPESFSETQPLTDQNLTITADVRLDNRKELLAILGGDPSLGDAGLLVKAYRKWGAECVSHLLGDFAFFIWDAQTQTGFAARDHFGVRPFYYHRQARRFFAFASDPAAVLTLPEVPRIVNESRIADYLVPILEGSDKTSTFYRDIFRLPPAHRLTITANSISIFKYWATDAATELQLSTDAEYSEAFRDIFTAAVADRLRSAGTVGVMLSGGLDSCAVGGVAYASSSNHAGLRAYSCLGRDADACPETEYVDALLGHCPLEHRIMYDDELHGTDALLDEHFGSSSDLFDFADIPLIVYQAAERDGVHVMLDGVDGDVVAAANALYLTEYSRHGLSRKFLRGVPQYAQYYGLSPLQGLALVWNQGVKPVIKDRLPAKVISRREQQQTRTGQLDWNSGFLRDSLINHEFAARIGLGEKLVTITGDTRWGQRESRENDAVTLNGPIIAAALERYDRLAASRSIEARHPFFDKRVVEFCLSLPLSVKQAGGWAKSIVRDATKGTLPEQIRWRRHSPSNLNMQFFSALMRSREAALRETLRSGLKEIAPYVNHGTLSDALAEGSVVASQPESLWKLYQALRLLFWLRRN